MKERRLTTATAATLLALALAVTGCSSKAGTGKTGQEDAKGVRTGDGITDKVIPLGVLTDLTGVYASLGKSVTQAQQLWAKEVNAKGGVCGRTIRLTVRDHGYDPQKAVSAYTELEPTVAGYVQFIGSPFVAAVKQRVETQDKGLILPQAWSASLLGSPYVRVVGATYDIETINALDFLLAQKKIAKGDRIGHVYFEGDYGENALQGSKYAAERAGLTIFEQKIKPTDNDMTAQVTALRKAGVKAVMVSAGPRQAASLVGVAAAGRFAVPIIGNNSAFSPQLLATPAGPALQKNYYVASSTLPIGSPEPGPSALAKAYRAEYPKDSLDNGVAAGYSAGKIFEEVLTRACADKNLTREGMAKAVRSMNAFDNGFGMTHDFTDPKAPSTRQSVIMQPDARTPGGLKVVQGAATSKVAEGFTFGG
ncbi:ABC transporter substrate-binding protein [Streptomyces sp. NBC_00237]|uniref:ABC transporter substrate-binding protein n=1 Tax=Streptomyces sp. NBC_00237 TaxID=2975687 RepID=UPI0022503E00|nr:ABC transporter substrate-binding protein [Streptomyces sp. NBC_00237]MCX5203103.1 ABC transporter substrate-binding protein [Streptomyces sp. NBC_00237]